MIKNTIVIDETIKEFIKLPIQKIIDMVYDECEIIDAIDAGEVNNVYMYNIDDSPNLLIKWFYKNVLELPKNYPVDTNYYTQREEVKTPVLDKMEGIVIPSFTVSRLIYYRPLCNLEKFLENAPKELDNLFKNQELYSKLDEEDCYFQFLLEKFYENFCNSHYEVQIAFAKYLQQYIKSFMDYSSLKYPNETIQEVRI